MRPARPTGTTVVALASLLWFGAAFGFFFAWTCSTLWGLDNIDPRAAIEAMNGMNASVRNPVFFTVFFLTPVVGAVAALLCWTTGARTSALLFGGAIVVYLLGVMAITSAFNVPLNESLAETRVPTGIDEARAVWADYSGPWQGYNLIRTVTGGAALLLAAVAVFGLSRRVPTATTDSGPDAVPAGARKSASPPLS